MPVFDASALNDNDRDLAFLRAVLLGSGDGARPRHGLPTGNGRRNGSGDEDRHPRSASGLPLIVGVPVSIALPPR